MFTSTFRAKKEHKKGPVRGKARVGNVFKTPFLKWVYIYLSTF